MKAEVEQIPGTRVEARCQHFGTCGGCSIQDVAYEAQLEWKRRRLATLMERVPGFGRVSVDIVGLQDPWRYRNKMEFTFGQEGETIHVGLHRRGSFWRIVDIQDCLLIDASVSQLLQTVRAAAEQSRLPAYNPKTHVGFWRYLVVRHSRATGQLMVLCITNRGERLPVERLASVVVKEHPQVASFWWGMTSRVADVAIPESLTCLRGQETIEERVGHLRLMIHPLNFIQPSVEQAEQIYEGIAEAAGLSGWQMVYDLYCGVGAIGMYLARRAGRVIGIESEPANVDLATRNVQLNGLDNMIVVAGKVEVLLTTPAFRDTPSPDLIVVDPPRAGVGKTVIGLLAGLLPHRLIYLSCNVESLVQDLGALYIRTRAYRLTRVTAYDMFAHTRHLEALVVLDRA